MSQTLSTRMVQEQSFKKRNFALVSVIALVFLIGIMSTGSVHVTAASMIVHVKPARGIVNRNVTVSGLNFPPSTKITVKFDSKIVATTTSNTTGTFSTSFKVPQAVAGAHTITVGDGKSVVTKTFTVVSHISDTPMKGLPGRTVSIMGTGFAASSTVKITFNGVQIKKLQTNSTGGFSSTYNVPSDPAGSYPVVATDGKGNTANATFTVT